MAARNTSPGSTWRLRSAIVILLAWSTAVQATDTPSAAVKATAALKATAKAGLEASPAVRRAALEQVYRQQVAPLVEPSTLKRTSREDLRALLDAGYNMAAYTDGDRYYSDIDRIFALLEQQPPVDAEDVAEYGTALMRSRRLGQAAALASRYPAAKLEAVPQVVGTLQPTAYRVSTAGDVLIPLRPALAGTWLLMITHPLCPFSPRAETAMAHMQGLPEALRSRMLRLAPVGPRLHLAQLREWNATHDGKEILLAHREADWPMVKDWDTPNFYLLQDGQVIDNFSGWPREGNEDRLRQLLDRFEACMAGTCPAP